jgi:hypothetical protein
MNTNTLLQKIQTTSNLDDIDFDIFPNEAKNEFILLNKQSLMNLFDESVIESSNIQTLKSPKRKSSIDSIKTIVSGIFDFESKTDDETVLKEIEKEQQKKLKTSNKVLEAQLKQLFILKEFYSNETSQEERKKIKEICETILVECKESIKVIIGNALFAPENVRVREQMEIQKKKVILENYKKEFGIEEK